MNVKKGYGIAMALLIAISLNPKLYAQLKFKQNENFDAANVKVEKVGRGQAEVKQGFLVSKDAYAVFGQQDWKDYEIQFNARTPANESQVQIWAGFRASDRNDRYVIALRGGAQNDLYLARLGYMGTDDHLALRHLDFELHPGVWYKFKIQVADNRIRVFLNDESQPRIDVIDHHSELCPEGRIILGGGWIPTEYDNLSVSQLSPDSIVRIPYSEYTKNQPDKEKERQKQRSLYRALDVIDAGDSRTEVSLNGEWLFKPGYEIQDERAAVLPGTNDSDWHVMHVPDFWNPCWTWQFGERYNTVSKGASDSFYEKELERCKAYTFDYKKTSVGWYRQWLNLPANIKGKELELTFDAVSKVGEVWINGKKAKTHIGMFGNFSIDASSLLKAGRNLIAVKVSRDFVKDIKDANKVASVAVTVEVTQKMLKDLAHGFYDDDPAGIWQPVSLIITNPVKIEDVFIKPNLHGADVEITVKNHSPSVGSFYLSTDISATARFLHNLHLHLSCQKHPSTLHRRVQYAYG